MNLPIEIVPGHPRRFRWKQTFTTPVGPRTVEHVGTLPLNLDDSVAALIDRCKQLIKDNQELHERAVAADARAVKLEKELMAENAELKNIISGMAERINAQSELLSKAAEKDTEADPAQIENAKPWAAKLDKANKKGKS